MVLTKNEGRVFIMDDNMKKVTEEFISQRVNYHGSNETEAVNSAFMALRARTDSLREALTKEQQRMLRHCEDAYRLADGETCRFYYTSGFGDAIRFITDWIERR